MQVINAVESRPLNLPMIALAVFINISMEFELVIPHHNFVRADKSGLVIYAPLGNNILKGLFF